MINRVILQGYVGGDPEIRSFESGSKMARIRIATTEKITIRKSGEVKEHTEWHTVIFWGDEANIVDTQIHKGTQLYIEGAIRSREWSNKDGAKQRTIEIVGNEIKIISQPSSSPQAPKTTSVAPTITPPRDDVDDIPF